MKPSHRIYCPDAGKKKLRFDTEKKALNYIKFNGDEIEAVRGYRPVRAYYCVVCGCWHVSSKQDYENPDGRLYKISDAYKRSLDYNKKCKVRKKSEDIVE